MLAAGCIQPIVPSRSAPASVPLADPSTPTIGRTLPPSPAPTPYQAPDFEPLPPGTAAGAWVRQIGAPSPAPTPSPTPTAVPTPLPLPSLAGPPLGRRFGLPGGMVYAGPFPRPGQAVWITDEQTWSAFWRAGARVPAAVPQTPEPAVTPYPMAFEATRALVVSLLLADDEADPIVSHIDEGGLHVVVAPRASSETRLTERIVTAFYQLPAAVGDVPLRLHRRADRAGALERVPPAGPSPPPAATPEPPEPTPAVAGNPRGTGGVDARCVPTWALAGRRPGLVIALGMHVSLPPTTLVAAAGDALTLLAHGEFEPIRWRLEDPGAAELTVDPAAASPPPPPIGFPVDWGRTVAGCRVKARQPGPITVSAESGGRRARALLAFRGSPAPAIAFRFADGGRIAPEIAPATYVLNDAQAWAALWQRLRPANAQVGRPAIDFERRSLVVLTDDRYAHEEAAPVLTHVRDGAPVVVFPRYDGVGPVRRLRRMWLFQTGKLPPGARVSRVALCDHEAP